MFFLKGFLTLFESQVAACQLLDFFYVRLAVFIRGEPTSGKMRLDFWVMKEMDLPPWEVSNTKTVGRSGEDLVAAWLREHRYVILDRNWRWHRYELDLVARREDRWVVVEVKKRTHGFWDPTDPESVIRACLTRRQENRIRLAMDAWARYKRLRVRLGLYLAVVHRGEIQWYLLDDG